MRIAEIVPFHMPEVLPWKKDGKPEFAVPGYDVTSRKYLVGRDPQGAAAREPEHPPHLRQSADRSRCRDRLHVQLSLRGVPEPARRQRVYDWETLNANAKYYNDARRAAMKNWENKAIDIRTDAVTYTMKRRDALRMVMMKVLEQNKIDVFVNPSIRRCRRRSAAAERIRNRQGFGYGAMLGIPEVFVPAGFSEESMTPSSCSARTARSTTACRAT